MYAAIFAVYFFIKKY